MAMSTVLCDVAAAIHLLELLLAFNASERITADEAFSHAYFADFRHVVGSDVPEDWTVCFRNEARPTHLVYFFRFYEATVRVL